MRVTLADNSFIDCSMALPLYQKLYEDLQSCFSRVSKTVYVGGCVLCCALPSLTNDMVLGMNWLQNMSP